MSMNFLFGISGFNVNLHDGPIKKNALRLVAGVNNTDCFFSLKTLILFNRDAI